MGRLASACPGCGNRVEPGQVVCVGCGYHLGQGKALSTKVKRVQERAQLRKAKRKAASFAIRLVPHGVTLLQSLVLILIAYAHNTLAEAGLPGLRILQIYIVCGGGLILVYAIREAGLWALFSDFVVWWVLMRDDCNPYIVGVVFNIGLCMVLIPLSLTGQLPGV